ncbi:hypothetical protein [Pelagibius sp. 7325]|uniref:hypothetical protein n=1 Tax=Pelagibius sp. 7325 TaxID=3131994 RepID=UPI0030EB8CD2
MEDEKAYERAPNWLAKAWAGFLEFGNAYATAIAVAIIGLFVTGALGSAELRVKNFELAVNVLSNPETPLQVKVFAVDVLKATIPDGVVLSEDMEESLKRGTLILSATGTASIKSSVSGGGATIQK